MPLKEGISWERGAARKKQWSEGNTGHQSQKNRFNKFCYLWSSLFFSLMVRFTWDNELQQKINQVTSYPINKLNTHFKPEMDWDKVFGHFFLSFNRLNIILSPSRIKKMPRISFSIFSITTWVFLSLVPNLENVPL